MTKAEKEKWVRDFLMELGMMLERHGFSLTMSTLPRDWEQSFRSTNAKDIRLIVYLPFGGLVNFEGIIPKDDVEASSQVPVQETVNRLMSVMVNKQKVSDPALTFDPVAYISGCFGGQK